MCHSIQTPFLLIIMMFKNSIIIQFTFFVSVIVGFSSCKKEPEKTQVTVEDITESVYASGIIESKNQYQVFSTVNGLVQ